MAARIRKGDTVVVITGADKGRRGEVLRVFPRAERALVQGVKMATKHTKPSRHRYIPAGSCSRKPVSICPT